MESWDVLDQQMETSRKRREIWLPVICLWAHPSCHQYPHSINVWFQFCLCDVVQAL